jgi:hypothetical protein
VVGELQKVRAEHDALLKTILADGGMGVQTRQVLLNHLRDEEQEHIDAIDGLVGGSSTSTSTSMSTTTSRAADALRRGLSVGSLRNDARGDAPRISRGTVGSLRGD